MRILAVVVAGLAICPANAQQPGTAKTITDNLAKCRDIADADQRLTCFDKAVEDFTAARVSGDLLVIDREGIRDAKRTVFGYSSPDIALFGNSSGNSSEPEVSEIDSTITSVQPGRGGLFLLGLADQSQWQTTESRTGLFPKSGKLVRIKAGMLGSYTATIEGGRSVKVKRVR